jgi:hypothetical protein
LTKQETALSSREKCLRDIDFEEFDVVEGETFVRLHAVGITAEGDLQNKDILKKLVDKLDNSILILSASDVELNEDAKDLLKALSEKVELGVLPTDGVSTGEFIAKIEEITQKEVTFIAPRGDDWIGKDISIPEGVDCCIVGAWDQSITPVPCKKIDLFLITEHDLDENLEAKYDLLTKADHEVGISIPVYLVNEDNLDELIAFVEYIKT